MKGKKENVLFRGESFSFYKGKPLGFGITVFGLITGFILITIYFFLYPDSTLFHILSYLGMFLIFSSCSILGFFYGRNTEVRNDGIYILSFLNKAVDFVSLDNISKCYLETKNRYLDTTTISRTKRDKNDNQYGCHGVRIEYDNGDEVFLGSTRKEELLDAINKAIQLRKSGELPQNN